LLYVVMGGSSTGKDSIINKLKNEYGYEICVSSTTRPKRENEKDGIDYHFISIERFLHKLKNNELLEVRDYPTSFGIWYYGLDKSSVHIDRTQLVILDAKGYETVVNKLGKENVTGIYIYANERDKIIRALNRESNREDLKFYEELYRRMLSDLHDFDLVKDKDDIYKVKNEDLEYTVKEIDTFIKTNI